MQHNVNLPADVEAAVRRKAATAGQDVETFIRTVVTDEVADELEPAPSRKRAPGKFAERIQAWAKLHPVLDHPIDDSREAIYEGRGE